MWLSARLVLIQASACDSTEETLCSVSLKYTSSECIIIPGHDTIFFFFFVRCHLCVLVTLKMFAGFSGLTCWPKQHWWCHFRGLRVCKVLKKRWVGIGGINDMFARRLSFMSKLKRYFGKMVLREIQEIKRDWPYLLTEATGQTR